MSQAQGQRMHGTRFDDKWKNEGTPNKLAESRLVVQTFDDNEHGLMTNWSTV